MATTTWQIDPNHSAVEFAVKHMMFTTVRGRFKDVKGTIEVDEQNPDRSVVNVEIAAASIDTGSADRDTHLRSADFLDVENHPTLTFRSKRVEGAMQKEGDSFRVVGDLTIRGTTMEVTLDAADDDRWVAAFYRPQPIVDPAELAPPAASEDRVLNRGLELLRDRLAGAGRN